MAAKDDELNLGIEDTDFEGGVDNLLAGIKDTTPEIASLLWELRQITEASDASTLKEFLTSIRAGSPSKIAALIQACPTKMLVTIAKKIDKDITLIFANIAERDHDLTYADALALVSSFRDFRSAYSTIHSDLEKAKALRGNAMEKQDEDTDLPSFDSLKNLNKLEIKKLLKIVRHDVLIVAFANGADSVCDVFSTVMNKRAADMLLEDIDHAKNINPRLIKFGRRKIQEAAKSLSVLGEIKLN